MEYIEDHSDPGLFDDIKIVVDIDNQRLECSSTVCNLTEDTLILNEVDFYNSFYVALKLIGYATVVKSLGDVDQNYFKGK